MLMCLSLPLVHKAGKFGESDGGSRDLSFRFYQRVSSSTRVAVNATLEMAPLFDLSNSCVHGSRGCLGCFTKPPLVSSVDDPSKEQQIQGQAVKKRFNTDYSWSTSPSEMDNSVAPSQRSISSISTSNQTLDPPHSGAREPSNPSEFVNRGLLLWNQTRQQWTANKGTQNRTQVREPKIRTFAQFKDQAIPLTSSRIVFTVFSEHEVKQSLCLTSFVRRKLRAGM